MQLSDGHVVCHIMPLHPGNPIISKDSCSSASKIADLAPLKKNDAIGSVIMPVTLNHFSVFQLCSWGEKRANESSGKCQRVRIHREATPHICKPIFAFRPSAPIKCKLRSSHISPHRKRHLKPGLAQIADRKSQDEIRYAEYAEYAEYHYTKKQRKN